MRLRTRSSSSRLAASRRAAARLRSATTAATTSPLNDKTARNPLSRRSSVSEPANGPLPWPARVTAAAAVTSVAREAPESPQRKAPQATSGNARYG